MTNKANFFKALKSLAGVLASLSVISPIVSYFLENAPPLFEPASFITAPLAAGSLYFGFISKTTNQNKIRRLTKRYIIISILLVIIYIVLLDNTTVLIKTKKDSARYQIGWRIEKWSLTKQGIAYLEMPKCEAKTAAELLMCTNVSRITYSWKATFVIFFGVLNIIVFLFACILWTYGWGIYMKLFNDKDASVSEKAVKSTGKID